MATQIAFLEQSDMIRSLARIGLANYFAGALVLPYAPFLQLAERLRYDIDLLGRDFGMGFETICHRLSTLQCPEARGVPFFFVRIAPICGSRAWSKARAAAMARLRSGLQSALAVIFCMPTGSSIQQGSLRTTRPTEL